MEDLEVNTNAKKGSIKYYKTIDFEIGCDKQMEIKYNISNRELVDYIRRLVRAGGDKDWIAVRDVDMHVSKQAFLISALSDKGIVAAKTATRAFTRRENDFLILTTGDVISHVMLRPDYSMKAREAGL